METRTALPVGVAAFVGRQREREKVADLVAEARVVTLTGSGGCGKTRLAVEVAGDVVSLFSDGACWVDLQGVNEPRLVATALGGAVGVHERPGRALTDTLAEQLQARHLLVVLDNCEHLVEAYIDSIEQPTGLVGWSGGANSALAVAAQSDAVVAVAACEPGILSLMDGAQKAVVGAAVASTAQLAAKGDLAAAVRAFLRFPFNDEEVAVAEDAGFVEAAGRYVTNLLNLLQQEMEHEGPTADDPAVLSAISAPVLLLLGSNTKSFFMASARHVADHVPNTRVQEIPGAGHAAPLTHPEALAEALTQFFARVQEPA